MSEIFRTSDIQRAASTTQALQASEASLNAIFDANPDAMLISDAHGIIVMASRQIEHLLGFEVAELIGQPVEVLMPSRYRAQHPALRSSYVAAPRTRLMGARREIKALRKDGSECDVEIGLSQVTTPQ